MSPKRSELSCIQRTRKRIRRVANSAIGEGFFGTISRLGRLHPLSNPAKHGVQVIRDIEYLRTGNPRHRLDIYRPTNRPGPLPIVLYMHGGAFHLLSKNTHWLMGLAFARAGYLVFNVDYRLAPQHPYPAAVADICSALEWLADNAEGYGGDLSRLVFAGESAGGGIPQCLDATDVRRTSLDVAIVVCAKDDSALKAVMLGQYSCESRA